MNKKLHIKKGDMVYVNAGNDKGKTGKVLEIITKKDRAIVEGVNMVSNRNSYFQPPGSGSRQGRSHQDRPPHGREWKVGPLR